MTDLEPEPETIDPETPTTLTEMETLMTTTPSTAVITGRPQKDIRLKVDGEYYETQVSSVEYQAKSIEWQGGTPEANLLDATHELVITAIQALDDEDSFTRIAWGLRGQRVEIEWQPHADAAFKLTSTITIPFFNLGGKVNQFNETTLTCKSTDPVTTS